MSMTVVDVGPQMMAFLLLPSLPESVRMARFHVRAALGFSGLGAYADVAETITSELVTNAVKHVCADGTDTIGITLTRIRNPPAVTIFVSDSSAEAPVIRETSEIGGDGRGLVIVDALSDRWGWGLEPLGKAVFAILATETDA
jgi:anti-sigma regulatory factor (Ser/Thr protein kinase)